MAYVLIVDDEKNVRITLSEFLLRGGHDVQVAEDATTAMGFLEEEDFDVAICDIILPRVTGVDLLKAIRKASPYVQVVVMTGEPTVESASESLRAGAFDYLLKPIAKEAILKTVANAAKVKALDDERRRLEEQNRRYRENLEHLVEQRTKALIESESRYRQLVHHSPDGIAVHYDGKVVFANEAMARMLGGKPDDIIGQTVLDLIHPDCREIVQKRLEEVVSKGKLAPRLEETFVALDGGEIYVDAVALPFSHQGKPAVQVFVRDITEQKRLEGQLRESQKMEAIGQLAGGIAHDFNNILTGVIGYTHFSLEQLEEGSPVYRDIAGIQELAKRAADLTRQLLAFSRRQALRPTILNLNALIANITKMLGRIIGENIELEFKPAPDLGNCRADAGQIEQALMNLALNSRDAMLTGGGLVIETSNVELDRAYADERIGIKPGPYVMMSVTDSGEGMDEDTLQHVFEPFFTTKEVDKGTGLGLSTVYGIVRQHGGNVWAYSEPNKGATFKICLPRVYEGAEEAIKGASSEPAPMGSETLLLVEDDGDVRKIVERALKSRGYKVLSAALPQKAEKAFAKHRNEVDLLVTDVVMPERSGRELYNNLRETKPTLKVLYMSGYTADAIAYHGVLPPGASFVQKPFNASDLVKKVREVLDG